MPLLDYITTPYAALWSLLESNPAWCALVKPANRIKWTSNRLDPRKPARQDADFPECEISLGQLTCSLASAQPTFGLCAWIEQITQTYILTLTHADLRIAVADDLKIRTLDAIRAGLPNLNLPYVSLVGPITQQDTNPADHRLISTFHIPIQIRLPAP